MKNKSIYVLIFILSFLCCKRNLNTKTPFLEKDKSDKIDSLANRYHDLNRFSGTIVVSKDKSIIYNNSFGFANYESNIPFKNKTAFKIGEITKLVTENILRRLAKKGMLQLTDGLVKYLPETESDITVNNLLTQNTDKAYNTLGRLIEIVSDKTYQENVEYYSKDLDLENTYFQKENPSEALGYLYHNFRGQGLELQKSPAIKLETAFASKGLKSTGSDLIKIVNSNPVKLNISGYLDNDGFSYSLVNNPQDNISIIVLSNRRHPVTKEISSSIEAILKNHVYKLPLDRKPFNIDKSTLKDFSGNYSLDENINFEVINYKDSLFVLMGPNRVNLIPQSSNQFYMKQMDASMRFLRDSTNNIDRVILLDGFIDSDKQAIRIK